MVGQQFNPEIEDILKEFKINYSAGILCLLGIYYRLDIETVVPEEVIKQINLTKIVEKDYKTNSIQWVIPLFVGQETNFEWVADWMTPFKSINPDRAGSARDAIPRMKDFFKKYPEFRKEDVYKARDAYFKSLSSSKYLMLPHKFIFDGAGAMKKSTLLGWCEKVKESSNTSNIKGRIVS